MRYLTTALIILFGLTSGQAQIFEAGPYIGGSNFIGDVGSTNYISPNNIAFGGVLKWNRSKRHAWRMSIVYTDLTANDADSDDTRRMRRGYSFNNGLLEGSIGMEFNFWEWNIYARKQPITPYLYTGLAGFSTNNLYFDGEDKRMQKKGQKLGLAIPMVMGAKGRLGQNLVLAVEIGARMTFHDNLDGSAPTEFSGGSQYTSFGNKNTNDWYMFTGITLTYSFGQRPCYDTYE